MKEASLQKAPLLAEEESQGEKEKPWQVLLRSPRTDRQRAVRLYCLLGLNAILFLSSLALYIRTVSLQGKEAATLPPCVHRTDMEDARSAIEYEEQEYTGALVYDPETQTAARRHDADVEYFGPPTPLLDENWHQLLHGKSADVVCFCTTDPSFLQARYPP